LEGSTVSQLILVVAMAVVWFVPTFIALSDLERRQHVRRVLVWKWRVILCIPVAGAPLYFRRGRAELDRDLAERAARERRTRSSPGVKPRRKRHRRG
jgi:hypothetical protein